MNHELKQNAEKYNKRHQRKKRWRKVIHILSCIVVFCTTYALILPAITLDAKINCGMEEHQHDASCYLLEQTIKQLVCTEEEGEEHIHGDDCYVFIESDGEPVLICEKTEHMHTDACFEEITDDGAEEASLEDADLETEEELAVEEDLQIMALAEGAVEVADQAALKTAIESSASYIQLKGNFSVSGGDSLNIPNGADITLDLNGYTLSHQGSNTLFSIGSGGTLNIVDSQNGQANTGNDKVTSLTYAVMGSAVTDPATGATKEETANYTVTSGAAIYANSNKPLFTVSNGGTLNLKQGMLCGSAGSGRAIEMTNGTVNLDGGYIFGFTQSSANKDNTAFGGAIKTNGGTLNLNGSVIAGNTAQNGGAIYATNTALNINGGVISGNTANRKMQNWGDHSENAALRCGGGGIYADGDTQIKMTGGYITMNTATDTGYFDGGGGVFLSETADMLIEKNGYITGNQAQGGSGIRTDFGKQTSVTMTGGYICSNVATTAEGAGIAIDRNGVCSITGGYINNNRISQTKHWGGGGLFCADGATMYLTNALITENQAGGFGGGIAGCPTGKVYLYVDDGCALYENDDIVNGEIHWVNGGAKDKEDYAVCDEFFQTHGHEDYFCAKNSTVTGMMLGGSAANWEGSADGTAVKLGIGDAQTATIVMGLKANPAEEGKAVAQGAAKVYINGNYSYTHGGGILCNGSLIIGKATNIKVPAHLQFGANKVLLNGSGEKIENISEYGFQFELLDGDGNPIGLVTCDDKGDILFDSLELNDVGEYTYIVREVLENENSVPGVEYDNTQYRITITVGERRTDVGETTITSYIITKSKVETSTDGGNTWGSPVETSYAVQNGSPGRDNLLLQINGSAPAFKNRTSDITAIYVQKKWAGDSIGADSVTVILKKDGEEIDRKTLNRENNWSESWTNLESGHVYTVEEVAIPGYEASYTVTTTPQGDDSISLGQGSWWVPATELVAGQQYMIVSGDGSKALYVSSGHENHGFDTADVANVNQESGTLMVNGRSYTTWYSASGINSRCAFTAETRTKGGHTGTILKNKGTTANSWLLVQSANSNYLKSTSGKDYASNMVFENGLLKGHNGYDWKPTDLRTVIYENGKFNTTTNQSPANAAKLYTLVSGEGSTATATEDISVVITNTPVYIYELPETGGIGTHVYTICGLLLVSAAMLGGYKQRHKGERGQNNSH